MISLSIAAIICALVFEGNTETLIPLYAVGVFVPFTLALFGLVKCYIGTWRMIIPLLAMLLTATVVSVLIVTKWQYIWPVVFFVPVMMYGCYKIHRHYEQVQQQLTTARHYPSYKGQLVIVPISGLYETTNKALQIAALQTKAQIIALYVGQTPQQVQHIQEQWQQFAPHIRLVAFVSSNQRVLHPLVRAILRIQRVAQHQQYHVVVAIPQLVTVKKWHSLLHNHHAFALKQTLLAYPTISVMTIPFRL